MASNRRLRIGSRGSDLALWQARHVAGHLGSKVGVDVDIIVIKTEGDRVQHLSLDKVEGKGFFTKEIEAALLAKEIDVAVHSYKDLPIESPPGLSIRAVPERAPVSDVVLLPKSKRCELRFGLPKGARVGTSSIRRKAQLLAQRPDLNLVDLRGNVPTRASKVARGELDAVVLAEAGLGRLGLDVQLAKDGIYLERLPSSDVCPAPAQGALAVQIRSDDAEAAAAVHTLHHPNTAAAVDAERALLARFGGGCHLPLGALATLVASELHLLAVVAAPDGSALLRAEARGADTKQVVEDVHQALIRQGAAAYLG